FLYFFSSFARSGRVWMQLMQQNVQKSRSTTLPRRSFKVIGPAVFSQATPPSNSGAGRAFSSSSSGFCSGCSDAGVDAACVCFASNGHAPIQKAAPRAMGISNRPDQMNIDNPEQQARVFGDGSKVIHF